MENPIKVSGDVQKQSQKVTGENLKWTLNKGIVEAAKEGERITSEKYKIRLLGEVVFNLYPKGSGKRKGKSVDIFLVYPKIETASRKVNCIISFKKNGELRESGIGKEVTINKLLKSNGCMNFCSFEVLKDVFVNETLTIVADLTISDENLVKTTYNHDDELLNDLKKVSSLETFFDFTILCGGEKFPCHKVILASRSEVLKAMLVNETDEKLKCQAEVKDARPPIVKVMLDFIYQGKIPVNIKDICGDTLYLATKYDLPGLVEACEVSLFDTLCKENALATLVIIDRHCPESVTRKKVIKYIAENILDIIDSQDWDRFAKEHSLIVKDVMKSMAMAALISKAQETVEN